MDNISPRTREGSESEGSSESLMIEHRSKILKLEGGAEVGEQLLPGIPNEITMDVVVPKLPWIDVYKLSLVCRRWRRMIRSRQVYHARVRTQSTQTLLVMDHGRVDKRWVDDVGPLALYSLSDGSCYHLPLIPGFEEGGELPYLCEFCFLDGKLYVLAGYSAPPPGWYTRPICYGYVTGQTESGYVDGQTESKHCGDTYVLDIAGQREWKQCASMAQPRVEFGCGVMNGKIYVFGGSAGSTDDVEVWCGSEVYDPALDAWSSIAPMELAGPIQQVFAMGEDFYVHFTRQVDPTVFLDYEAFNPLMVYNPLKNEWRSMGDIMHFMDVMFTAGGKLHKLVGRWGAHGRVDVFDTRADHSWKILYSSLFGVLGSIESFQLSQLDAVAVDDELLCVANCIPEDYLDRKTYLMRSQGLGSPNKEIEWEKTRCSLSFNNHQGRHILCPIQL